MATRQYIGARYIPVFADPVQWSSANAYAYLTMVQNAGETFMSKQEVPVGIDLPDVSQGEEDNDYWVHMSNWNAQVEVYRQEVLQYNGRISTLEDDLPLASFDSENTVAAAITAEETARGLAITAEETARKAQDDIRAIDFDTVADMKASTNIKDGMTVHTLGFYSAGDGGDAYYTISDTGTANEMDVIACGDLFATLVQTDVRNVKQYGAHGDDATDDADIINYVLENALIHSTVYFPMAQYKCTKTIIIPKPLVVKGDYTGFDYEEYTDLNTNAEFRECLIHSSAKIAVSVAAVGIELRDFSVWSDWDGSSTSAVVKISSEGTGARYEPAMRSLVFDNCTFIGLEVDNVIWSECSLIVSSFNLVRTIGGDNGFAIGYASSVSTSLTFTSCYALGAKTNGYYLYNLSYCSFVACAADGFSGAGVTPQTRAYQIDHSRNVSFIGCGGEVSTQETMLVQSCDCVFVQLASSSAGKTHGCVFMNYSNNITLMNCVNETWTAAVDEIGLKSYYSTFKAINCKNMGIASIDNSTRTLGDTFRWGGEGPGNLNVTSGATLNQAFITYSGLSRFYNLQFTASAGNPVMNFDNWLGGELYVPVGATLMKIAYDGTITFLNALALQTYSVNIPLP